ncbi:autoinducer 2 ABC transporter substrate-binding protein [Kribbella sp. NPDC051587]|uniref:autoinducer 2 ABC transporter substrate-binding protein n=1 Tax=Kribbella sp. NPDC051587 TaxID=3364119 RepID=UPI003796CD85
MLRPSLLVPGAVLIAMLAGCGTVDQGSTAPPAGNPSSSSSAGGAYINVVKLTGIAWFDRMNAGVKQFATTAKVTATQTGPSTNSPEQQVSLIQGLIAQKPAALAIVPSDPSSVIPVIKQARAAGIKVVTHEAPALTDVDADIEAFDNAKYGQKIMTDMAACMKGTGEYVQFVGTLTAATHMAWTQAAYELQQQKFPGMKRVSAPVESNNNGDQAYRKAKELLQAHPKLAGFQGASSEDIPGIARAVKEAGLQNETCVFGTGVPSQTKAFVDDGSIDAIYLWDPELAGEAMLSAAKLIVDGKQLADGTNLGVKGYEKLAVSPQNPKVFLGDAMLVLTRAEIGNYDF